MRQPVLEIAKRLAEATKIPLDPTCVKKIKGTPQLKNVHQYGERITLLKGAFEIDAEKVMGKNILLVDDLFRSGATVTSIVAGLKSASAESVYILALTRTRSNR